MIEAAQVAAVYAGSGIVAFGIAVAVFRDPLSRAIDRWKGANLGKDRSIDLSGGGPAAQVEAQKHAPPSEPQTLPAPAPDTAAARLPELPPPNAVLSPLEADLRRRIEDAIPGGLDIQMAWAVRIAVAAQVERDHEQTYRLIFGSQIAALKELNTRGPLTVAQTREIYHLTAVRNHPEVFSNETFEEWGDYLLNRNLVAVEHRPVNEATKAVITPLGRDFLHFMTARALTEYKWG